MTGTEIIMIIRLWRLILELFKGKDVKTEALQNAIEEVVPDTHGADKADFEFIANFIKAIGGGK